VVFDEGVMTLTMPDIAGPGVARIGMLLDSPTSPVRVSGSVAGTEIGIKLIGTPCSMCEVQFHDLDVQAGVIGISVDAPNATIAIQNVSIRTDGGGWVDVDESGIVWRWGYNAGIQILAAASVSIQDVAITADEPSSGDGISIASATPERLEGISIQGYDTAVDLDTVAPARFERVAIECSRLGIAAARTTEAVLRAVSVRNCTDTAVDLTRAERVDGHDLHLSGNRVALALSLDLEVVLSSFNISDNDYGLLELAESSERETGTFRDGIVSGNRFVGMESKWKNADVAGVVFTGNGYAWPDPEGEQDPAFYGAFVHLGPTMEPWIVTIRGSSFVANAPYAVVSRGGYVIDARDNWWGGVVGPLHGVLSPGVDLPGETVAGIVLTTPHLIAPP
jgi:hypothetical protein